MSLLETEKNAQEKISSYDNSLPNFSSEEKDVIFGRLQKIHIAAALFMGVQTIAYGAVGASVQVKPTVGFPTSCEGPICEPDMKILGEVNPIWIITLFVAMASFDHLVTFIISRTHSDLCKHWLFDIESNPLRWMEYSVSGSIMAIGISILTGIHDVHLWLLIFSMHAIGMFLGFLLELLPRYEINRGYPISMSYLRNVTFSLGVASFAIPWLVIFCYFFKAATREGSDIPDFVYVAFLGTFVLFCTFGLNSFFCHNLKWYDFHKAEFIYVILSFTAKTFLAADVFGGLNAQSDDDK